jgi:hypothetical protein
MNFFDCGRHRIDELGELIGYVGTQKKYGQKNQSHQSQYNGGKADVNVKTGLAAHPGAGAAEKNRHQYTRKQQIDDLLGIPQDRRGRQGADDYADGDENPAYKVLIISSLRFVALFIASLRFVVDNPRPPSPGFRPLFTSHATLRSNRVDAWESRGAVHQGYAASYKI